MRARESVTGLFVVGCLAACETPPPPGELVGRYSVTGTVESDSCGPGLGANRAVAFTAELRDDSGTGYWIFADLRPTPGSLDEDGSFFFQQQAAWTLVSPRPGSSYTGCRVTQVETIDGKIARDDSDAGVDNTAAGIGLTASNTIDLVPLAGDDCSPGLATQGGPLMALPCRVEYQLVGVPLDAE